MASTRTISIELQPQVNINVIISQPETWNESQETPAVVFLHFWGGSARTWSSVTPHISERYRTVALDFRGWGNSTGPTDASGYSITALAEDVEATINALGLTRMVLVGLSMGAKVAQLLASRMCSTVAQATRTASLVGLVLISPAPPTPLELPPQMREQQLHAYETRESAAFVAKNVLTATFQDEDLPDFVVEDMIKGSKCAREAWPAYAMGEDVSGDIAQIDVPVLVLAAERDLVEPVERIKKEVCDCIAGARMHILPGTGHLSPLDVPEVVAQSLMEFVDTLPFDKQT